jgi:dimethylargininase
VSISVVGVRTIPGSAEEAGRGQGRSTLLQTSSLPHDGAVPIALVRRPGPRLHEGLVTHIERTPVDAELALEQWFEYVAAMEGAGWDTIEVAPADDCPDAVFVEDPVIVHRGLAILTRPGARSRRGEVDGVRAAVSLLRLPIVEILAPGTLDGGDVLEVGDTLYVGRGGRTNAEGIHQLRRIVGPLGTRVVAVPTQSVLHLKSAVTALPDEVIVGYPPLVDVPALFPSFLAVPEESGAHVVALDDERLLLAADCPRTAALYADLGYSPVCVDISEFQRLEGCVTCLSVRIPDRPSRV